jgi:CRISPR-associated protein Cas2
MRRIYVVTYDISSPKRWRHVYKTMKGFGQHIQLSVFRCDLTASEVLEMKATLEAEIDRGEDQVLIVDLGPSRGRAHRVEALGRPHHEEERGAKIL